MGYSPAGNQIVLSQRGLFVMIVWGNRCPGSPPAPLVPSLTEGRCLAEGNPCGGGIVRGDASGILFFCSRYLSDLESEPMVGSKWI